MSSWFRLYTDVLNDPKVQWLTPEHFKGWINILCIVKENGGLLPPTKVVAFRLRITEAEANSLVEVLTSAELLDHTDEGITPHNWETRQFLSDDDPTAAIRARRHRLSKREVTDASRVTSQTSHTPQSRDRAETDSESEQSRGGSGETPSPAASPAKPRSASRQPKMCDDEYLAELQANPAYAMLDVRRLYLKMVEWCRLKRKQPTRGRLVNWLNKEDVPMTAKPGNGVARKPQVGAPLPAQELPTEKADNEMLEIIEDWIAYGWLDQLGNEYDAIIKRGGAKVEWEIRCVAYYELHKQTTTEV